MRIVLEGRPITKKNSQRIVLAKNGKRFLIQSKQYLTYENDCLWQIKEQLTILSLQKRIPKPVLFPIMGGISLQVLYYMPTRRRPDLLNLLQATADILEKARVIDNDRNIISFDGSRIIGIDRINPRTEIEIEEINEKKNRR